MRLVTGTRTRLLVDLTFEFDPAAATVQLEVDDDGTLVDASWVGPAVHDTSTGTWVRTAQSDGFYLAGPADDGAGATVLPLGRHFTTAHVAAGADSFVTPGAVIDVVGELQLVTVGELRDYLANQGGAGSRTASQLADDRLAVKLEEALGEVKGSLWRFAFAPGAAPPLLRTITLGIGAYLATLEYFGSQQLEQRDPVVLAYDRARSLLSQVASGALKVDGVTLNEGSTSPTGDAEVYGGVNVGLASGWLDDMADVRHNTPAHYGGMTWG